MADECSYKPVVRILRVKQVKDRIGLSRSTIYDRLNPKSPRYDIGFPKPVSLGGKAVGWLESEVCDWIQGKTSSSGI